MIILCSGNRFTPSISRTACWDIGDPNPGQTFTWAHLNRVIRKYDFDMIYISGPGHGAPAVISNCYLEGTYSEIFPRRAWMKPGSLSCSALSLSRASSEPMHARGAGIDS